MDEVVRPECPHDGIGALMTRLSGELSLSALGGHSTEAAISREGSELSLEAKHADTLISDVWHSDLCDLCCSSVKDGEGSNYISKFLTH